MKLWMLIDAKTGRPLDTFGGENPEGSENNYRISGNVLKFTGKAIWTRVYTYNEIQTACDNALKIMIGTRE